MSTFWGLLATVLLSGASASFISKFVLGDKFTNDAFLFVSLLAAVYWLYEQLCERQREQVQVLVDTLQEIKAALGRASEDT